MLLENGVTVVAEAAFRHDLWESNLVPLAHLARLRLVQCYTDPETARRRIRDLGPTRRALADAAAERDDQYLADFRRLTVSTPSIHVDTTAGYTPSIEEIVAFVNGS